MTPPGFFHGPIRVAARHQLPVKTSLCADVPSGWWQFGHLNPLGVFGVEHVAELAGVRQVDKFGGVTFEGSRCCIRVAGCFEQVGHSQGSGGGLGAGDRGVSSFPITLVSFARVPLPLRYVCAGGVRVAGGGVSGCSDLRVERFGAGGVGAAGGVGGCPLGGEADIVSAFTGERGEFSLSVPVGSCIQLAASMLSDGVLCGAGEIREARVGSIGHG